MYHIHPIKHPYPKSATTTPLLSDSFQSTIFSKTIYHDNKHPFGVTYLISNTQTFLCVIQTSQNYVDIFVKVSFNTHLCFTHLFNMTQFSHQTDLMAVPFL